MTKEQIITQFKKMKVNVKTDEVLSSYTSFKVGGVADIMVFPTTIKQICKTIKFLNSNKIKWIILGNCTNVLVGDDGVREVVVKIGKRNKNNFTKK
jgi:UDP-N-acetylmuramate dehydrogenase